MQTDEEHREPVRILMQDGGPLVRYFSVHLQQWMTQPPGEIPIREYAAMSPEDRERVLILCNLKGAKS